MNIGQIISSLVPALSTEDTGERAIEVMEKEGFQELPVISGDDYIALVREHDLYEWAHPDQPLNASEILNFKPAVRASVHPFEAMRVLNQMNLSVLPVIDNEHKYLGSVTRDTLLKYITENSGIDTPGGIIVLEVPVRNYTLYEISRICENEDVIILNLQVHPNETGMLDITLKLNKNILEPVVASFERHGYHVKEYFGDENKDDDITDNYNLLMNYIYM